MSTLDDYLSSSDAAKALGVSPGRVRQLTSRDELPSIKVGHDRLIPRGAVEKLKNARKTGRKKSPTR